MMAVQPKFPDLGTLSYWGLLLRKLPRGIIWSQQAILTGETYTADSLPVPLTALGKMLFGFADELGRIHTRLNELVAEAVPASVSELLDEWAAMVGVPEWGKVPADDAELLELVKAKVAATGGQSASYFEGLALANGAVAVVTDGPWTHWWTATMAADCTRACCASSCDAALVEFTTDAGDRAARALTHYKPAHTGIFWDGGIAA